MARSTSTGTDQPRQQLPLYGGSVRWRLRSPLERERFGPDGYLRLPDFDPAERRDRERLGDRGKGPPRFSSANLNTNSRLVNGQVRRTLRGLTSAEPAGIAVNPAGFVFITGNLRPNTIEFPLTPGSPNNPTAFSLPTIQTRALGATPVLDPAYTSRPIPEYPTTEGFSNDPSADRQTTSTTRTYIGGDFDEMVFGPGFDSSGNVIIAGWSDGARSYASPVTSGNPPIYTGYAPLPAGAPRWPQRRGDPIKPNADSIFPGTSAAFTALSSPVFAVNDFAYTSTNTYPGQPYPDNTIGIVVARDGIVLRINPDLPAVTPLAIGFSVLPATIEPLDSTAATVTVNVKQALDTRVRIASTNGVPISSNALGITNANALFDLQGVSLRYGGRLLSTSSSLPVRRASASRSNRRSTATASRARSPLPSSMARNRSPRRSAVRTAETTTVVLTKADGTLVGASGSVRLGHSGDAHGNHHHHRWRRSAPPPAPGALLGGLGTQFERRHRNDRQPERDDRGGDRVPVRSP